MKTLAFSAALAAAMLATSAFAHSDKPHGAAPAAVVKEQKEWGIAGDARAVNRTITLRMKEMRFSPDRIVVKQGETIRFVLHNHGKLLHEMVIGTRKELDAHAALMLKFPSMEHDEPYMAHVSSGKASEMIWTFNRPGSFEFACLIAGHFQAGMVGKITVTPSP